MKDVFDAFYGGGGEAGAVGGSPTPPVKASTHVRPGAYTSLEKSPYEKAGGEEVGGASDGDSLHNDRAPYYELKSEKPEHRTIILLKAQGITNKEIASITGYTPVAVSNILRQPWARKQLVQEINSAGRSEVIQLFKGAAVEVAEMMIDVVNNDEARTADKLTAGSMILDRLFGKASQALSIDINDKTLKTMSDAELLKIATGGAGGN